MNFELIKEIIPNGWCSKEKAEHLYNLVKDYKPSLSIEIGSFSGRSLIPIALGHEYNKHGIVLGIDTWSKQASVEGTNDKANDDWWALLNYNLIYNECNNAIDKFGLNEYCGTVRLKSLIFGELISSPINFIHQDGNHSEEITCAEVKLFAPKITSGGIWVSDDTRWPTVQASLLMIVDYGFELIGEFPNGDNFYKVFRKF